MFMNSILQKSQNFPRIGVHEFHLWKLIQGNAVNLEAMSGLALNLEAGSIPALNQGWTQFLMGSEN
jgi:hypothetical protein